ncbi:hypothetical protein L596_015962 [Steinernema carpocapsae]|uniref:Uncharacterized protein n=1 Tax=Steinernema carpocapsae TaxID=34508 RepID=A0A4U5NH63_STECR|nr:hypothetical protein L596_015962 [Steinernema carpocapsae]
MLLDRVIGNLFRVERPRMRKSAQCGHSSSCVAGTDLDAAGGVGGGVGDASEDSRAPPRIPVTALRGFQLRPRIPVTALRGFQLRRRFLRGSEETEDDVEEALYDSRTAPRGPPAPPAAPVTPPRIFEMSRPPAAPLAPFRIPPTASVAPLTGAMRRAEERSTHGAGDEGDAEEGEERERSHCYPNRGVRELLERVMLLLPETPFCNRVPLEAITKTGGLGLACHWDNNGFFLALRPLQRRPRRLHRESRAPRLSSSSVFRWPTPTSTLAPLATRPSKGATDAVGGILNGASGAAGGLDISKILGGVTGVAGGAGGPLGAVLGIVESLLNVILGLLGSLGGIAGGAGNPLSAVTGILGGGAENPLSAVTGILEAPLESSEAWPTRRQRRRQRQGRCLRVDL